MTFSELTCICMSTNQAREINWKYWYYVIIKHSEMVLWIKSIWQIGTLSQSSFIGINMIKKYPRWELSNTLNTSFMSNNLRKHWAYLEFMFASCNFASIGLSRRLSHMQTQWVSRSTVASFISNQGGTVWSYMQAARTTCFYSIDLVIYYRF